MFFFDMSSDGCSCVSVANVCPRFKMSSRFVVVNILLTHHSISSFEAKSACNWFAPNSFLVLWGGAPIDPVALTTLVTQRNKSCLWEVMSSFVLRVRVRLSRAFAWGKSCVCFVSRSLANFTFIVGRIQFVTWRVWSTKFWRFNGTSGA